MSDRSSRHVVIVALPPPIRANHIALHEAVVFLRAAERELEHVGLACCDADPGEVALHAAHLIERAIGWIGRAA